MENGDSLYARIAELEKENEYHRNRTDALYNVWYEGGNCGDELKDCLLLLYNKDFLQEHFEGVFDDHEFSEDEDSEEEEEVLEDLTCDELKTRLRAINKPVGGRKADLIKRIREHEEQKEALFKED
jgi:hypothetical protein